MIQLQEGFRGCPFLQKQKQAWQERKKVKNTVLTKVKRNLVSKMSDDTKKKKKAAAAISFQWTGYS